MSLDKFIKKVEGNADLNVSEAHEAFDILFAGRADEKQMAAFLLALHDKGESADEITGATLSMRSKMECIDAPEGTIDIVGTGGDGRNTLNVSTGAALVVAGCGVRVAKHGNLASSGNSGSSDVLEALGVNLEPSFAVIEQCLEEAGLCFLFAPRHHPAMRHVAAVRRSLQVRTIFNLLGPLTNPAKVKKHLIGVYDAHWLRPMAHTLKSLGSKAAWLTHGQDGLDEITTSAPSDVVVLKDSKISHRTVFAMEAGIKTPLPEALTGRDSAYNAEAMRRLLAGVTGAYRDIVLLNAAAALVMAGRAANLNEGAALGAESLDSGAAKAVLTKLVELTHKTYK